MADGSAETAAQTLAELVPRLGRLISAALERDPALALSLRQYRMLERLSERPHRNSELATSSGVTQPTASAAVASLEARGLANRAPDPADRRSTLILLTDEGRDTLARARNRVLERLAIVTSAMTDEDAEALRRLRPVLIEGMDRARAHPEEAVGEQSGHKAR